MKNIHRILGCLNLYQVVGVSISFEHIPLHLARINMLAEWPSQSSYLQRKRIGVYVNFSPLFSVES